jgi:hypothetical protein
VALLQCPRIWHSAALKFRERPGGWLPDEVVRHFYLTDAAGSTAGHDVCSDRRAKKPRNGVLWRASGRCWATAEVLCWRTSSGPAGCSAPGGEATTVSAVGAGALYAVAGRVLPWPHLG